MRTFVWFPSSEISDNKLLNVLTEDLVEDLKEAKPDDTLANSAKEEASRKEDRCKRDLGC